MNPNAKPCKRAIHRIASVVVAAFALTLAGCATTPQDGGATAVGSDAVNVRPDSDQSARARIFTELAGGYFARGQYKIVLAELRKAIQADPNFSPAYNLYGLVYMELAEDDLAAENFRRALSLDKNDSVTRTNYGWFMCTRGRHDEGLAEFAAAIRNPLYDQPDVALSYAAQCAELKGDLDLADTHYQKVLKLTPDSAATTYRVAALRFRQARYDDARRLLERLAQLASPTPASLWLGLRIERKLGDSAQEAAYAQQLLRLFPDTDEARRLQARQYE